MPREHYLSVAGPPAILVGQNLRFKPVTGDIAPFPIIIAPHSRASEARAGPEAKRFCISTPARAAALSIAAIMALLDLRGLTLADILSR
jgi:hypothetical protein